jgi:hypothetical protein
MLTKENYLAFRRKFEPQPVRLVVVAESPPRNQTYLYNLAGRTNEWLFSALMKQLEQMPQTKEEGLRELQRRGWVLLDATYEPVDWLGQQVKKRNAIIERDYPLLVTALEELSSDRNAAIILIKANVCKLLDWRLTRDGFNVLNKGIIVPFPSHGQQPKFHQQFARLLKTAGLSDRAEEATTLGHFKMSGRYKGWQNAASIRHDFPYVVELEVPLGGFGTRLDRIYGFHIRVGVAPRRGRGRRKGKRDIVCWRFADAETAQAFADECGGVMLFPPSIP